MAFTLSFSQHLYFLNKDRYKKWVIPNIVYDAIHMSKQNNNLSSIVILGDSVASQLFEHSKYCARIYSMTSVASAGMVGHYILLNNYLKAGNHVDAVYLLFIPESFYNNLHDAHVYNYFLKPFYIEEYYPLFTENVWTQIHKIPYYQFCRFPHILTSNWSPDLSLKDDINYSFISPISAEYLIKIKELSIKHNFKMVIVPMPARLSKKSCFEKMNKKEIANYHLENEFKDYFKNILYLPDSNFRDDTHLKNPENYREYYLNNFIK
jgi:hypothetical protein